MPPAEMLQRQPDLPHFMAGGPNNPLGARAHVSRLDALPHPRLERALDHRHSVSSGCIRMRNEDVIDLYSSVKVGTKVMVI